MYNYLKKPAFTPSNWLFGSARTALYTLMGIALFLIWRKGISSFAVKMALIFFAIQLVINAIWSPVFFGLRSPGIGMIVTVALWIAIVFTIRCGSRVSQGIYMVRLEGGSRTVTQKIVFLGS